MATDVGQRHGLWQLSFSESCTFDSDKNLILAMNTGNRGDTSENDGFVSLINPDGSVHTPKWIGATRDGLELYDPLGSAISNGVLYTVDWDTFVYLIWKQGDPCGPFLFLNLRY